MVAEQNVTCSLPVYKYQIAPLARGYSCAVADRTFMLAKFFSFCHIGYRLLWDHSTREWFSFYKIAAPGPCREGGGGVASKLHQEQHPRRSLDGYGFRILYGAPRNRSLEGFFDSADRENHQCLRAPPAPSGGRRAAHRDIPGYGPPRSGRKQNLPVCCCWGR